MQAGVSGVWLILGLILAPAVALADYSAFVETYESKLAVLGFDPGAIDGRFDRELAGAVSRFQSANGLKVTGNLQRETRAAIDAALPSLPANWRAAVSVPEHAPDSRGPEQAVPGLRRQAYPADTTADSPAAVISATTPILRPAADAARGAVVGANERQTSVPPPQRFLGGSEFGGREANRAALNCVSPAAPPICECHCASD